MMSSQITVLVAVVLAIIQTSTEYRTHETVEEGSYENYYKEETPTSGYFDENFDSVLRKNNTEQIFDGTFSSSYPTGFPEFYSGNHFIGLHETSVSNIPRGVFSPSWGHSNSSNFFVNKFRVSSSGSGYLDSTEFQPPLDVSSSANEEGFRSSTFPPRIISGEQHLGRFFPPRFGRSKQNLNREVQYRTNEKVPGERTSITGKERYIEYSKERGNTGLSQYISDSSSETEYGKQSFYNHDEGRGRVNENISRGKSLNTPYSIFNHYQNHSFSPQSSESYPKNLLSRPRSPKYHASSELSSISERIPQNYETGTTRYSNVPEISSETPVIPYPSDGEVNTHHQTVYYRPLLRHSSAQVNGYSRLYYPMGRSKTHTTLTYNSGPLKHRGIPRTPRKLSTNYRMRPFFTPIPRDLYSDNKRSSVYNKRRAYLPSPLPRHFSQPQTEQATELSHKIEPPAVSPHKQKKFFKKEDKFIYAQEYPKYESQRLKCYTCKDKSNNTYEECRYEPDDEFSYERTDETRFLTRTFPSTSEH